MHPEKERRKQKVTKTDLPPVVMDGQMVGNIGQETVPVKGPTVVHSRRVDDPKPESPHDMGVS